MCFSTRTAIYYLYFCCFFSKKKKIPFALLLLLFFYVCTTILNNRWFVSRIIFRNNGQREQSSFPRATAIARDIADARTGTTCVIRVDMFVFLSRTTAPSRYHHRHRHRHRAHVSSRRLRRNSYPSPPPVVV